MRKTPHQRVFKSVLVAVTCQLLLAIQPGADGFHLEVSPAQAFSNRGQARRLAQGAKRLAMALGLAGVLTTNALVAEARPPLRTEPEDPKNHAAQLFSRAHINPANARRAVERASRSVAAGLIEEYAGLRFSAAKQHPGVVVDSAGQAQHYFGFEDGMHILAMDLAYYQYGGDFTWRLGQTHTWTLDAEAGKYTGLFDENLASVFMNLDAVALIRYTVRSPDGQRNTIDSVDRDGQAIALEQLSRGFFGFVPAAGLYDNGNGYVATPPMIRRQILDWLNKEGISAKQLRWVGEN